VKKNSSKFAMKEIFFPLIILLFIFGISIPIPSRTGIGGSSLVSIVGVHYLGNNYLIDRFYVNQEIGDSIGEGGGGGSIVCCISLPKKWSGGLKVEIRWKVHRIIDPPNPSLQATAKIEGIYQALVPIEKYRELGNLYVHFFPGGRVRVIVAPSTPGNKDYAVKMSDPHAEGKATSGKIIGEMFTKKELSDSERKIEHHKRKYGDWR